MPNDDLIQRIKILFDSKSQSNLNKADKAVGKLKKGLAGLNMSLKDIKSASKQVSTLQKLQKQFDDNTAKARKLKDRINDLKNTKGKTAKSTEKLNRKLREAQREYSNSTKKLGPLRTAIHQVKSETKKLGIDTNKLSSEQARLARMTDKLKDQEIALARTRRRNRGVFSAGAALARGGLKPGSAISAGAALNAGGMTGMGGALIGGAAIYGGASALRSVFSTGAQLEKTVTDIGTRQTGIDKAQLSKIIQSVNEDFIFNLQDTGSAFSLASRSGIEGSGNLQSFSRSALKFAQAEDLSATKGTDILIKLGNSFGRDKIGGADELANLLSATATGAATNVPELFQALKGFVKPARELAKLDTDEILGVTSLLADVGLGGARGTTSFKTAFAKVIKGQSKKFVGATENIAAKTGIQIDVRDPETGGAIPFLDIMRQLEQVKRTGGRAVEGDLQIALAELIGSRTLPQALTFLEEGVDGILARAKKLRALAETDITGRLAASRLGTAEGQSKRFTSVLENVRATAYQGGLDTLGFSVLSSINDSLVGMRSFMDTNPSFMKDVSTILASLFAVTKEVAGGVAQVVVGLTPLFNILAKGVGNTSAAISGVGAFLTGGNPLDTFAQKVLERELLTAEGQDRVDIQDRLSNLQNKRMNNIQGRDLVSKLKSGQTLGLAEIDALNSNPDLKKRVLAGLGPATATEALGNPGMTSSQLSSQLFIQKNSALAKRALMSPTTSFSGSGTTSSITNNVEIKIDGTKDPESTALAVKQALQNMTATQMEVPLN
jgi:hypothetical protein